MSKTVVWIPSLEKIKCVKGLPKKPDHLSLISGLHLVEEEEKQFHKSSDLYKFIHHSTCMLKHMHIHTK